MKPLAIYAFMKRQFSNSLITNYTPTRVTHIRPEIGISRNTVARYVRILLENDLAYFDGPHLRLVAKLKLAELSRDEKTKRPRYYRITPGNVKHILLALRCQPINTRYNQINYKPREKGNKFSLTTTRATPVVLSLRTISVLLNVSPSTAARVAKQGHGTYFMKYNFPKYRIGPAFDPGYVREVKRALPGIFEWKGALYQKLPSMFAPREGFEHLHMVRCMTAVRTAHKEASAGLVLNVDNSPQIEYSKQYLAFQ
jgi:hypothetical protein